VPKARQAKIDCSGVVNSTFAALCQGVGQRQFQFDGDANLWALLTTIARRKAIDRLRRKVNHEGALEELAPTIPTRESAGAEEAELRDSVSALCEQLSEAEMAYLALRLQGGWQQTEIAEQMQVSTRQVRRIARSVELKALALFDGIKVEGASPE
jgi:RNA polymerase sigma factor (sigma-70 family)